MNCSTQSYLAALGLSLSTHLVHVSYSYTSNTHCVHIHQSPMHHHRKSIPYVLQLPIVEPKYCSRIPRGKVGFSTIDAYRCICTFWRCAQRYSVYCMTWPNSGTKFHVNDLLTWKRALLTVMLEQYQETVGQNVRLWLSKRTWVFHWVYNVNSMNVKLLSRNGTCFRAKLVNFCLPSCSNRQLFAKQKWAGYQSQCDMVVVWPVVLFW